ncbi:hypothetical protein EIP86_003368 [Pleurotus ostreatoroseus]|nr:hypothetical protein EIP86_003368 [Pleurotus ostreatoroseus]
MNNPAFSAMFPHGPLGQSSATQSQGDVRSGPTSAAGRSDAESDSISTLMSMSVGRKKRHLRDKKRLRELEARTSPPATPSTPFHTIVESNTGFSPINPRASLPDVLERSESATTRTPSRSPTLVRVPSPLPSPPSFTNPIDHVLERPESTAPRPRSRSPNRAHVVRVGSPSLFFPGPIDRVLSSIPPTPVTPVVTRPPYREVRPQLFQDAFVQSIGGGKFDDTRIHVFSARTRAGTAHEPRVLHARSAFLEAASVKFEDEIYDTCTAKNAGSISRTCSRIDYGYDGDSDLEDCEQDPPIPSARATKDADKQPETISSAQTIGEYKLSLHKPNPELTTSLSQHTYVNKQQAE